MMIDNPDCTVDDLMKVLPGPDFPTGGIIMGRKGIRDAYETGKGSLTIRSKCRIEEGKNGKHSIVAVSYTHLFKMAQVELIAERLGQNPVLLLDDVMSELDATRRDALLSLISGEVQTLVTATNAEKGSPALSSLARVVQIGGE